MFAQREGSLDLEVSWLFSVGLASKCRGNWALLGLQVDAEYFFLGIVLGFEENLPRFHHTTYRIAGLSA